MDPPKTNSENLSGQTSDLAMKLKESMKDGESQKKVEGIAQELKQSLNTLAQSGGNDDPSRISAMNDGKEALKKLK